MSKPVVLQQPGETRSLERRSTTGSTPELAVVILAVGAPRELGTAVESLQRQSMPLEIVIVNSGGGDPRSVLPEDGPEITIISVAELLWPGAARNLGIRASRAPWIAFMASDHIAKEDWAAARLELHRRGHRAVACAVVNSHPRNLYAWAYHIAILVRRLPGTPPGETLLYGVSYSRALLDQHGGFREDLRIGEDTDFNERLAASDRPVWAPSVQTIHRNPTTFRHMVSSQYARGRRSGFHWPHWHQGSLLARTRARFTIIARVSWRSVHGLDRFLVVCCWPLLFVCVCAYGLGVTAGRREGSAPGTVAEGDGWFERTRCSQKLKRRRPPSRCVDLQPDRGHQGRVR